MNTFEKLAYEQFAEARANYIEAAEGADLDSDTTRLFLERHGMADRDEDTLVYEWLSDAVDFDGDREITRDIRLPDWLQDRETEQKVRTLLTLPPCGCGESLACPEIMLNMLGHENEHAVRELLHLDEDGEEEF